MVMLFNSHPDKQGSKHRKNKRLQKRHKQFNTIHKYYKWNRNC